MRSHSKNRHNRYDSNDRDKITINLTQALIALDIPADTAHLYEELVANNK